MNPPFRNHLLFSNSDDAPPTTIRTSFQRMNRPIQLAESNGSLRMDVAPQVVDKSMNTCPIFSVSDRSNLLAIGPKLQLERRSSGRIDLFNALNRLGLSVFRYLYWLSSNRWKWIPPSEIISSFQPVTMHLLLQLERRSSGWIDLFHTLNPMASAILPYSCWLRRYWWIREGLQELPINSTCRRWTHNYD